MKENDQLVYTMYGEYCGMNSSKVIDRAHQSSIEMELVFD